MTIINTISKNKCWYMPVVNKVSLSDIMFLFLRYCKLKIYRTTVKIANKSKIRKN